MANVHRQYVIAEDAYCVRVEGDAKIHKFTGPNSSRESYDMLRALIAVEQKKDKKSRMIDHARDIT